MSPQKKKYPIPEYSFSTALAPPPPPRSPINGR